MFVFVFIFFLKKNMSESERLTAEHVPLSAARRLRARARLPGSRVRTVLSDDGPAAALCQQKYF